MSVLVKTSGGGKYRKGKTITSENLSKKATALTFVNGHTPLNTSHDGNNSYFTPMIYCEKQSNGEILSFVAYRSGGKLYAYKYRHTDTATTLENSKELGSTTMNSNDNVYITSHKNSNYICIATAYSGYHAYILKKSDLSNVETLTLSVTTYVSMYDDKLYMSKYGDLSIADAFRVYSITNKSYETTKSADALGRFLFANSMPIVKDGYIYLTCAGNTSNEDSTIMVCLNPDYTLKWKKTYRDLGSTSKRCNLVACVLSDGKFIVVGNNELRLHSCEDGSVISSNSNSTALGSTSHLTLPGVLYNSERFMILRQPGATWGEYVDLIDTTTLGVIAQLKLNYTSHFEGYAEGNLILGVCDSAATLKIGKAYPSDIYEILD